MDRLRIRKRIAATIGAALLCFPGASGTTAVAALDAEIARLVSGCGTALPARDAPAVECGWLERVYGSPDHGTVWFQAGRARPAIARLLGELRAAGEHGLVPADYPAPQLEVLVEAAGGRAAHPEAIARADVALTQATLRFLSDLRFGRVPPQRVEPHFRVRPRDATFVGELRAAAEHDRLDALTAAVEPAFPQYAQLKRLLREYRALAAQPMPHLPSLATPGSKIVAGDSYAGVAALRARLVALGDLETESPTPRDDRYTEALAQAVRRFQARHGLLQDGVLGKATLAALDAPVAARIDQIVLSLERLRWLPDFPPGPAVAVNIPSFQLWAFGDAPRSGQPALTMPVIVGRAMRSETPVFVGEMRHVEFSPYWNVPPSILRAEILPRLAKDPAYLRREDMEIVRLRGKPGALEAGDAAGIEALRSGEARLRQRPGPKNALGGVKFVLPNTMDIYLHATPARELFGRTQRDFSHGCIRVGDPLALASFVLRGRPEWTASEIEAAMASGINRSVPLPAPIPVVVFYTTALVDGAGRPHFLGDIYGHDRKLLAALRSTDRASP